MIDTYFKQYFWTFHLLMLGAAAFLLARTVNTFVGEALATPAEALASAPAGDGAHADRPKDQRSGSVQAFLDRNIFQAKREDLTVKPEAEEAKPEGEVDLSHCEKSTMQAGLVATMVAKHDEDSVAVFDDRGKKEPIVLRAGDKLLGEAEILLIDMRRVLVKHNGRCESFSLEEESEKAGGGALAAAPATAAESTEAAPVDSELGKDIKKLSESEYEIPRKEIEGVLSNLNAVATQARIVPSFNNGKANGFKLFSIRPGSLYSKIGIQNGDVVQRINGYEMNSPDKALEIYSKLKDAQSITVDMIRRGKSQTLSYNIR